jgi:protein-tyrosine kinase
MEKIKAALAKVKSENVGVKKVERTKVNSTSNAKESGRDIGQINYTTTKIVNLNSLHLEKNRVVSHLNHNANSSVFDSMRTQILQKMEENNWQTLGVVSPSPSSGKTLISINLAMSIARQPQKTVVLADFDFRKPKIASYLGINVKKSLNDYIEGNEAIENIAINPGIQRMVILPTNQAMEHASEKIASNKVTDLIDELETRYESRIIIFDLPPILNVDDAMIVLPKLDCVLMVIANGISTQKEIEDSLHLLSKENLVGVVYNMADEDVKPYYY